MKSAVQMKCIIIIKYWSGCKSDLISDLREEPNIYTVAQLNTASPFRHKVCLHIINVRYINMDL